MPPIDTEHFSSSVVHACSSRSNKGILLLSVINILHSLGRKRLGTIWRHTVWKLSKLSLLQFYQISAWLSLRAKCCSRRQCDFDENVWNRPCRRYWLRSDCYNMRLFRVIFKPCGKVFLRYDTHQTTKKEKAFCVIDFMKVFQASISSLLFCNMAVAASSMFIFRDPLLSPPLLYSSSSSVRSVASECLRGLTLLEPLGLILAVPLSS